MKVVLTSLNAKFIHSTLALFSLKKCSGEFEDKIKILEFTINNSVDYIFEELINESPDILCFSCYIWNIEMTLEICKLIKMVEPNIKILLGGPEVSFDQEEYMKDGFIDFIISGEGEVAFYKFLINFEMAYFHKVPSLAYRSDNKIIINRQEEFVELDNIPFAYSNLEEFENRILYYESQRGCPYNCQYCLSSSIHGLRFLSIDRVKSDLKFFLNNRVKQVKFIDRTFNASQDFAYLVWEYLIENDNQVTNFHFEISADILDNRLLHLLRRARKGLFQFEIGVQSTNIKTLEKIKRTTDLHQLFESVRVIKSYDNIHMHLDLIVGLPYEDYDSFKESFNTVFDLNPDMLQIGFLKLLRGSGLRREARDLGIVYREKSPYEVLYTNELNYKEVIELKGLEEMVERFYNSGQFYTTIKYLLRFFHSPFCMFMEIWKFYVKKDFHRVSHKKQEYYEFLKDFYNEYKKDNHILNFIIFDMYSNENIKTLLDTLSMDSNINKNDCIESFDYLREKGYSNSRIIRNINVSTFDYNILSFCESDTLIQEKNTLIFDYSGVKNNNFKGSYVFSINKGDI